MGISDSGPNKGHKQKAIDAKSGTAKQLIDWKEVSRRSGRQAIGKRGRK